MAISWLIPFGGQQACQLGAGIGGKSISTDILVINVVTDEATGQKNQAKWQNWNPGVELITIYSPYRMVNRPILNFINEVASKKILKTLSPFYSRIRNKNGGIEFFTIKLVLF